MVMTDLMSSRTRRSDGVLVCSSPVGNVQEALTLAAEKRQDIPLCSLAALKFNLVHSFEQKVAFELGRATSLYTHPISPFSPSSLQNGMCAI
jgi:hypothetical protein